MSTPLAERSLNQVLNRMVLRMAEGATVVYALLLLLRILGFVLPSLGRSVRSLLTSLGTTLLMGGIALLMRRWRKRPGAYEIGWMLMMISFSLPPLLGIWIKQDPIRLATNLALLPVSAMFIQRRGLALGSFGCVLGSVIVGPCLIRAAQPYMSYYVVTGALAAVAGVYLHLMMGILLRRVSTLLRRLQAARGEIQELVGFLPICAWCKNVRDDAGFWHQVEAYLATKSKLSFTHGMCPNCRQKVEAEFDSHFDGA